MASKQKKPSTEFIQRTLDEPNSATTFHFKDARSGRRLGGLCEPFTEFYKCLYLYSQGWNRNWRDQREVTQNQKIDVIESVATQLDLTTRQKERAKGYMSRVNCQKYSNVGGLNMVSMCLCQIIIRNDERDIRDYHPLAKPENNNRLFAKLFNNFGFDPQQMADTIQKLRYELSL